MKLLIAIPTRGQMPYLFVKSLTDLIRRLDEDGVDYELAFQNATLVYIVRDKLAEKAIAGDYSHVLWLDDDMVFKDDLLDDLMFCGKPFVTGLAVGRRSPHFACVFKEIYPGVQRWTYEEYPQSPFRIYGCGFACVLMETSILEDVWIHHGTCFFPTRELGEDVAFCKKAMDLGYEIWAEPTVKLGHIGEQVFYPEDEVEFGKNIQNFNEVNK